MLKQVRELRELLERIKIPEQLAITGKMAKKGACYQLVTTPPLLSQRVVENEETNYQSLVCLTYCDTKKSGAGNESRNSSKLPVSLASLASPIKKRSYGKTSISEPRKPSLPTLSFAVKTIDSDQRYLAAKRRRENVD